MKARLSILDLVGHQMFARWFRDPASWQAWFTFLAALFALPMSAEQRAIYAQCTGRSALPSQPHREAWLICGRRSGKSFVMALTAVYLAVFREWRRFLAPGETAVVMLCAADRAQANEILRYMRAFFDVPMLARLLASETSEMIELTTRVRLQVNSASSARTRGYAIAVAILDELSFWPTDTGSANPDVDVIRAIRPGQSQFGQHAMLLCASSPYAKRGSLYEAYRDHFSKDGDPVLVWKAPTAIMNPTVSRSEIDLAFERDPADAAAEFGAEFRSDVQAFVDIEAVRAVTDSVRERLPSDFIFTAFTDPAAVATRLTMCAGRTTTLPIRSLGQSCTQLQGDLPLGRLQQTHGIGGHDPLASAEDNRAGLGRGQSGGVAAGRGAAGWTLLGSGLGADVARARGCRLASTWGINLTAKRSSQTRSDCVGRVPSAALRIIDRRP